MQAWQSTHWKRARHLSSSASSRIWSDNARRYNDETIEAARTHVGPRGGSCEWCLDLRQQIRRGAGQGSVCVYHSQEQRGGDRLVGGGGLTRQMEGTAGLDTDPLACLDRPGGNWRGNPVPPVFPGPLYGFGGQRRPHSEIALSLGGGACGAAARREAGAVAGAGAGRAHGGSNPAPAAHPLGRLGHRRNVDLTRDLALGGRDYSCQKSAGLDEFADRRAG